MTRRQLDIDQATKDLQMLEDPQQIRAAMLTLAFRHKSLTPDKFEKGLVAMKSRAERILFEVKRIPPLHK